MTRTQERANVAEWANCKPEDVTDLMTPVQVGGQVLIGREWCTVIRLNRKDGVLVSVTTSARYCRVKGIEEIADVRPPDPERVKAVKAATKLPPLVNYPGEGAIHMTRADWDRKCSDMKTARIADVSEKYGKHRYRSAFVPGGSFRTAMVYLTDEKRKDPPPPPAAPVEVIVPMHTDVEAVSA